MALNAKQAFFIYSEQDLDAVRVVACRLREDPRVRPWLEHDDSVDGLSDQKQLLEALRGSSACVVFLRDVVPKPFLDVQIEQAIRRQREVEPTFPVIPVLLPGVTADVQDYLVTGTFLGGNRGIRFSSLEDKGAHHRLLAGILGIKPGELKLSEVGPPAGDAAFLEPIEVTHGRALVIGIAGYPHVRRLGGYTVNNARDVAKLLVDSSRCGFPLEQVRMLIDREATLDGLRHGLTWLEEQTKPDETVIVFFSGHGGRAGNGQTSLVPYDYDPQQPQRALMSMAELAGRLASVAARRLLVILDCCHAGGVDLPGNPNEGLGALKPGLDEEQYRLFMTGGGRAVLASSRADQRSLAGVGGTRNTLFTYFLLQALRGEGRTRGDGAVRVFDLFSHVEEKVSAAAMACGKRQTPVFKAESDSDFIVARCARR